MRNLTFVVLLFLVACSSSTKKAQQHLFDTKLFFTQQVQRLEKLHIGLKKKVTLNSTIDELTENSTINWSSELQPFIQLDLAKPANLGSFTIDTVAQTDGYLINYLAKDSSQKIDEVSIWYDTQNQTQKLRASFHQQNQFYTQQKQLTYIVDSGFVIETKQSTSLAENAYFKIEGAFIMP